METDPIYGYMMTPHGPEFTDRFQYLQHVDLGDPLLPQIAQELVTSDAEINSLIEAKYKKYLAKAPQAPAGGGAGIGQAIRGIPRPPLIAPRTLPIIPRPPNVPKFKF